MRRMQDGSTDARIERKVRAFSPERTQVRKGDGKDRDSI